MGADAGTLVIVAICLGGFAGVSLLVLGIYLLCRYCPKNNHVRPHQTNEPELERSGELIAMSHVHDPNRLSDISGRRELDPEIMRQRAVVPSSVVRFIVSRNQQGGFIPRLPPGLSNPHCDRKAKDDLLASDNDTAEMVTTIPLARRQSMELGTFDKSEQDTTEKVYPEEGAHRRPIVSVEDGLLQVPDGGPPGSLHTGDVLKGIDNSSDPHIVLYKYESMTVNETEGFEKSFDKEGQLGAQVTFQ